MLKNTFVFLLLFSFIQSFVLADSSAVKSPPGPTTHYLKNYNFSDDWFTHNIPVWEKILSPFKGKSNIHYLEIGVFEGR